MAARTKKLTAVALGLVALLGLTGPRAHAAAGPPGAAAQQRGAPQGPVPRQQEAPARIVSLVPALTEILFAVGAGPQVVGVSSYDDYPPETQTRPRVGALLDPDVERILSLKPDVVVIYGSQTDLEGQFARAGIRVYKYRHAGVANVLETIGELAALSGHADEGARLTARIREQLADIRARVRGRRRPRTMLVMGRDSMALRGVYVSGGVGFLHELLEAAGADNVFADVKREGVQPSNETMLARAPEVIIELHGGTNPAPAALERERSTWSLLSSIPAVRNGRVHLLYGSYLVSPGPRLVRAADALARVLHPEAFK